MSSAKILLVESEKKLTQDIDQTLTTLGYEVVSVKSSISAIESINNDLPDLVITEINLSEEVSGIELAIKIKERYDIPVIFLTNEATELTLIKAKFAEPYGYLLKPFDEKGLHLTIEMALYKFRTEIKIRDLEEKVRDEHKFYFTATFPNEIRTAFKQYLGYFNDFVKVSKNKEIYFEVKFAKNGLEIETKANSAEELQEIKLYLAEYLSFIKQNIDSLNIKFSPNMPPVKKDILILELRNEIIQLNHKLEIRSFQVKCLEDQANTFKMILLSNKDESKPININIYQDAKQYQEVSLDFTLNYGAQLSQLEQAFYNFQKVLNDSQENTFEQLDRISEELSSLNKMASKKEEVNLTPFKKIKMVLDDISNPSSVYGKSIRMIKGGLGFAKTLIDTYNSIAKLLGTPTATNIFS